MLNSDSMLSTLAEVAAFMKNAYPDLTLRIGKNGDHYAYRLDNARVVRFSQASPTAPLNLKKSLTARVDSSEPAGEHDQPWSGTGSELKRIVDEELRQYRMHFQRTGAQ
jgi:hypothetical protein